jgi:hypothetical protein
MAQIMSNGKAIIGRRHASQQPITNGNSQADVKTNPINPGCSEKDCLAMISPPIPPKLSIA